MEVANTQPPVTVNQIQDPTRTIVTNTISHASTKQRATPESDAVDE